MIFLIKNNPKITQLVHLWTAPLMQKHLVGLFNNLDHEKYCFTPDLADALSPSLELLLFMCWQADSGCCSHQRQFKLKLLMSGHMMTYGHGSYQCQLLFGCPVLLHIIRNSMDFLLIAQENPLWCIVLIVSGCYWWREMEMEIRTPLCPVC